MIIIWLSRYSQLLHKTIVTRFWKRSRLVMGAWTTSSRSLPAPWVRLWVSSSHGWLSLTKISSFWHHRPHRSIPEPVPIILFIAEATPTARRRSLENGTNPTQVQGSFLVILISILWVSVRIFKLLKTWVLQNSSLAGPLRPLPVTLLDPHTWWVCYICWSQIGHSEIMQMLSWSFGAIFVVILNWIFSAWPWVPWHAL